MNKNDDIHQNFEITEQFIREYCSRTELETKARDAALLLLNQLEECRKLARDNRKEGSDEEAKENTEDPVISEEKFKKIQNAKQGKKTYREYLRNQLKAIGVAGVIAMSTAVYSQAQIVYKNSIIVYAVLEKEFPILNTIKTLFTYNTPQSNQSQSSNVNSNNNNNNLQNPTTTPASTDASAFKSSESISSSLVNKENSEPSSNDQLNLQDQELIKQGEKLLESKPDVSGFKLQPFNNPIESPKTTNTNPLTK